MPQKILLLSVETCCGTFSVCVSEAHLNPETGVITQYRVLAFVEENELHRQAEHLIPAIERLLKDLRQSYYNLTHIAMAIGPGSFTGARIGMAAVYGIRIAISNSARYITIVPVTTLMAMAMQAQKLYFNDNDMEIVSLLDAGREAYYIQRFFCSRIMSPLCEPTIVTTITALDMINSSHAANILYAMHSSHSLDAINYNNVVKIAPKADGVALCAINDLCSYYEALSFSAGSTSHHKIQTKQIKQRKCAKYSEYIEPLYIREPDAVEAKTCHNQ